MFREYEKPQTKTVWTGFRLSVRNTIEGILVQLIDGWGSNVLFWVGCVSILNGKLSLGQLISFNALYGDTVTGPRGSATRTGWVRT